MNGLILSPSPFFSMTFLPSPLASISFKLSHPPLPLNPHIVSFYFYPSFSLYFGLPFFLSSPPTRFCLLLHLSLPSQTILFILLFLPFNFFFKLLGVCSNGLHSKSVSTVRRGPLMFFAIQTFTPWQCFPSHHTPFNLSLLVSISVVSFLPHLKVC